MAGGMAFGSTVGVLVEPLLGWRALFVGVAALGGVALVLLLPHGLCLAVEAELRLD